VCSDGSNAVARTHPVTDAQSLEVEWCERAATKLGRLAGRDKRTMRHTYRRDAGGSAEVDRESRRSRVIEPGGVDEQHVGPYT
jgi:hypothetical protein